jgi:hypothetical protein
MPVKFPGARMAATLAAPSGPSFENRISEGSKLRKKSKTRMIPRIKIKTGIPPLETFDAGEGFVFFIAQIGGFQRQQSSRFGLKIFFFSGHPSLDVHTCDIIENVPAKIVLFAKGFDKLKFLPFSPGSWFNLEEGQSCGQS